MAHYFETLDELGRYANAHRFTVDPGMSLFDLSLGGEQGARYFEQQPALRRVTGFIARQVGSVNLNLYSWDKGGDRKRQYPPDHPAAAFLENPADPEKQPGVTAMALKEQLLLDALIHDKYCALIRYDDRTGLPKSMVRLPASRVRFKGAAGVVHGATYHREDGQTVELDLSVLFFSVGYTPHTGANGVPQIKTLRALLDGDSEALEYRTKMLREAVRQREQRCVDALLRLYAFRPDAAQASALPLLDGRWGNDLFNPETLKQLGIRLGSGVAAGAATGAGIDLLVGGLSLGAASVLGALAGGGLQTARNYGGRLLGKLKGQRELSVDDAVLRLLAVRQLQLLAALEARGHAATTAIQLDNPQDKRWRTGKLPAALHKARAHPEWSALNPAAELAQAERQVQVTQLAASLAEPEKS